ncbi:MAG: hypothetical protein ACMG6E_02785, partial [Candidatus Roizmanbacteria bacterium]
ATVPDDFVLIVRGDLTISDSLSNLSDNSVAFIVTGALNIQDAVQELYGIYASSTIDLASDIDLSTNPLKIVGNLMVRDPTDLTSRQRSDENKPSLFVKIDKKPYIDLFALLGTRYYIQDELAQ